MFDSLQKYRSKKRFILEVRTLPNMKILDNRGELVLFLQKEFKMKFEHVKVSLIGIQLGNMQESPTRYIDIDTVSYRITYEDITDFREFIEDATKLIKSLYDYYDNSYSSINRIGVRFFSIFTFNRKDNFAKILKKMQEVFVNPDCPIKVDMKDFQFIFDHTAGKIIIGPVREGELWISESFVSMNNVPTEGIGIDIDGFVGKREITCVDDIISTFEKLTELNITTEFEIAKRFIKD